MEKEELKQECIKRMKLVKLDKQVIEEFENNNMIYVSQIQGNLEKANNEQMKLVKEYEQKRNIKIYHIIHNKEENIDTLCFQYVNNDKKEWKNERTDIRLGYDCVEVYIKEKYIKEIGIKIENGQVSEIVI